MNERQLNFEFILYIFIFLIALCLRFYNLGAAPLTDEEAKWALQSYQVAYPEQFSHPITIGYQPAYIFLTALIFKLFGTSNFLARFWPALSGTLLVLVPALLRVSMPRIVILIFAFGLSIDPGMVTVSRQAGGPMLALSFFILGISAWMIKKRQVSGVSFGISSLSGLTFYPGVIGLILTELVARRLKTKKSNQIHSSQPLHNDALDNSQFNETIIENQDNKIRNQKEFLIPAFITISLLGTYFFQYPEGIVAWFNTFLVYLQSWFLRSGITFPTYILVLLVFQPFALLFCSIGILNFFKHQSSDRQNFYKYIYYPVLWLGFTALLIFLNPSRQISILVWILVPIWLVAAWELRRYVPEIRIETLSFLVALFIFVFAGLLWYALIMPDQVLVIGGLYNYGLRLFLVSGILIIGLLTILLIAFGWSKNAARFGAVWGIIAAYFVYSIALIWGANQIRPNEPQEFWSPAPAIQQSALLIQSIEKFSNSITGSPNQIEIVSTVQNPSLKWVLRMYPNSTFLENLNQRDLPPLMITSGSESNPAIQTSYRGQDFVWNMKPGWTGIMPEPFLRWLTFREAPIIKEKIILWANNDLFPESASAIEEPVIEIIE